MRNLRLEFTYDDCFFGHGVAKVVYTFFGAFFLGFARGFARGFAHFFRFFLELPKRNRKTIKRRLHLVNLEIL